MRRQLLCIIMLPALSCLASTAAFAQGKGSPEDEAAIQKAAESFIEVFQKGDDKALAASWTSDGDYTDQSGRNLKGREAIEKAFAKFFSENKGLKLRIESDSLRWVTPEVAIEDGKTFVSDPNGTPPTRARYTIVHVKRDGKWLLSSVRDAPFVPPSNYEKLRGLEWMVGNWSNENGKGEAEHLVLSWTENQNFLIGTFTATVKGVSVGSATHWIGWDPQAKKIRSWIFDTNGGFGEGAWSRNGDKWVVKTTSVLQDGKKATATFAFGRVDADTLSVEVTDRSVEGALLPNKGFRLKRVK